MELTHKPCPYQDCSSSDAFSFNTDEGVGFCHSCSRGYPSKGVALYEWAKEEYPTKSRKPVEIKGITYEGIRGLDPDVAKLYGIQAQVDEAGDIVQYAFKYPNNVKYRDNAPPGKDKKIWMKERGVTILDLFGPDFNAGSSKRIYITEGEFDAASLFQALGKTYPVKSLPSSSLNSKFGDKFLKKNHEYLNSFQEIVYAGELSDKAGQQAAERLYNAYPEKFYYVPLTKHKDANDFLTAGDVEDLKWAALKPQRYSPDNFFCSDQEFLDILRTENPYEAVPTGHSKIDYMIRGLVRGGVTFLKAPPGTGKAQPLHSLVLVDDGVWKPIGSLRVGDTIKDRYGNDQTVTGVFPQGKKKVGYLVFSDGRTVECCEDHLWRVHNKHFKEPKVLSVKEILPKLSYSCNSIDFYHPAYDETLDLHAYLIGALIGDGNMTSKSLVRFSNVDEHVLQTVDKALRELFDSKLTPLGGCDYFVSSLKKWKRTNFRPELRELGLWGKHSHEKRVPPVFFTKGAKARYSLIKGLMDTDGYVDKNNSFTFSSSSYGLAQDFKRLIESVGGSAKISEKKTNHRPHYRVQIQHHNPNLLTNTPRKKAASYQYSGRPSIKSWIEKGEEECVCISVSGPDQLYVTDNYILTHNTELMRYFERAMLQTEDIKVAMIHMEEQKSTTLRAMATYELGKNVRTKEDATEAGIAEENVYQAALAAAKGDRTIIFEMRSADDPLKIIDYVRLACSVYGADFVFVDHVQRLTYLSGVDGATNVLTQVASNLAQLGKELNVGIIMISHVNEDGHTKYAKSLEEEAIICINIERDKTAKDETVRNTTKFNVTKNRPFSRLGEAGMVYFDPETTILTEIDFDDV